MKATSSASWYRRLAHYAVPYRSHLTLLMFLTFVGAGIGALRPWPLKLILDCVIGSERLPAAAGWVVLLPGAAGASGLLIWLASGTVLLFLLDWILKMLRSYQETDVGSRIVYSLGADLFSRLQQMTLRFHGRKPTGDLVKRVTRDSRCVQDLIVNVYLPLSAAIANLLAMFFFMWQLDRILTLVALVAAPVLVVTIRILAPAMEERSYEQFEREGELLSMAEQTLTALPLVKAFGREEHEDRRFRDLCEASGSAYLRTIVAQTKFRVGASAVTAVGTAGVMALGGMTVLNGGLTVGGLVVFMSYLNSLYAPVEALAYLTAGFASAAGGARRVIELLDEEDAVQERSGARPLPTVAGQNSGHIVAENVTFGYEPDNPVLHQVSFDARPGQLVALVGPTGAGKSTLVSLIGRFFDPWSGRITFDGMDLRDAQLGSIRSRVSYLLQDSFLLPISIADNIRYGRPEASLDDVRAAAGAAQATGFIEALPEGYDTLVGEGGATLSGGQQQRVAIARALLRDAPVLVLDEPTSALDAETERHVLRALETLVARRTTFVIAHRLSTVRKADTVLVFDQGRIVERGTHTELIARGALYASLHDKQFGG